MKLPTSLLALGVTLLLLGAARAESPTPFTTIVRAHWQGWAGPSGAIAPERLDQLMKQRKFHGEEAAAISAIKLREKDKTSGQLTTLTMKNIEDYEALFSQHKRENVYDKAFARALTKIKADPHTLYVKGAPHLNAIRQARNGDCWLLATIGCMIHRNPADVRKLIADDGDGTYTVHFAYHTFNVRAPTDAEIGAYTSDVGDGDWLFVMENAMGQFREKFGKLPRVKEANDNALIGGGGGIVLQNVLGRNFDVVKMTPAKPQAELVRTTLTRAFHERRLVILGTPGDEAIVLPKAVSHSHCLAVIGWNAERDLVTIWNPMGTDFEPKEPGPIGGYKTVGGVFSVPLPEFTKIFANITVDNDKPYKPDNAGQKTGQGKKRNGAK